MALAEIQQQSEALHRVSIERGAAEAAASAAKIGVRLPDVGEIVKGHLVLEREEGANGSRAVCACPEGHVFYWHVFGSDVIRLGGGLCCRPGARYAQEAAPECGLCEEPAEFDQSELARIRGTLADLRRMSAPTRAGWLLERRVGKRNGANWYSRLDRK